MKAITFAATLILLNLSSIKAGWDTSCEVEGADRYDWLGYFTVDTTINDDHEGVAATFKTKNIIALTGQSSRYLNASFKDEILTVFTNENFKKFEEEYDRNGYSSNIIQLILDFDCIDDESESLDMRQKVVDVNNHDPVLNKKVYEYNFGMRIPENYDLTKFLSISASDVDFSNRNIYFSIDFNENLRITRNGETDYDDKTNYFTTFTTLKEIKAPFRQEFTLAAKDGGNPARNTTALIIVTVMSNDTGNGGEHIPHPPVFSKHLYFGDYTLDNDLKIDEPIRIKYGVQNNTVVKQSGYEKYFKINLNATTGFLQVTKVDPLPKSIVETTRLIVIEIEAQNEGLKITGRTALIIRLPAAESTPENNLDSNSNNCSITYVLNESNNIFVIIYLCIAIIVVITNVGVLLWYCTRPKLHNFHANELVSVSQAPEIKKLPLY